jgi:hypothetical protein
VEHAILVPKYDLAKDEVTKTFNLKKVVKLNVIILAYWVFPFIPLVVFIFEFQQFLLPFTFQPLFLPY